MHKFENTILKALGEGAELGHPREESHGDFASNIAMKRAKAECKNPMELAEEIAGQLRSDKSLKEVVESIEIAKPGFINFTLKKEALLNELNQVLSEGTGYGASNLGAGEKVMIEYSQMNVAKPMHVGHLRTTILGDSLKRLYKFLGFNPVSDTHYGDWGVQFGMVLYAYKHWGDKEAFEKDPVGELVRLYIDMSNKAADDEKLYEAAKAEFKLLEDGDEENRKLWEVFVKESVKLFDEIYKELDILPFDYNFGESEYEQMMQKDLKQILDSGIATKEDQWIYVDLEKENLGRCVMQKSDGATTYHLRDISTYRKRIEELGIEKNLYVVDSRQSHHFKQLFKVIELLDWKGIEQTKHISYGFITLPEGALSTRKGRIIQAKDVLDQGREKALAMIEEKNPDLKNKEEVAMRVMQAAIKFAYLSANRESDLVFDWDKTLSFEGDTGPYLLYTFARIQSIIRKVGKSVDGKTGFDAENLNESEISLMRLHYRFIEVVNSSLQENDTHNIAQYLLELAHRFNRFYENSPIANEENIDLKNQRLAIAHATAQILQNGLALLGIQTVNEM